MPFQFGVLVAVLHVYFSFCKLLILSHLLSELIHVFVNVIDFGVNLLDLRGFGFTVDAAKAKRIAMDLLEFI